MQLYSATLLTTEVARMRRHTFEISFIKYNLLLFILSLDLVFILLQRLFFVYIFLKIARIFYSLSPAVISLLTNTERIYFFLFLFNNKIKRSKITLQRIDKRQIKQLRIKDIEPLQETIDDINDKLSHAEIHRDSTVVPIISQSSFDYTGSEIAPILNNVDPSSVIVSGDLSASVPGTYTITLTLKDYYKWPDDTTEPKTITWTINKLILTKPIISDNNEFTWDGTIQYPNVSGIDYTWMNVVGNNESEPGTYNLIIALKNKDCTEWDDHTTDNIVKPYSISKVILEYPVVTNTSFTYDGENHAPTVTFNSVNDSQYINITGAEPQINAGDYYVTAILLDKTHYQWSNGTTNDYHGNSGDYNWKISKKTPYLTADPEQLSLTAEQSTGSIYVETDSDGELTVTNSNPEVCSIELFKEVDGAYVTYEPESQE